MKRAVLVALIAIGFGSLRIAAGQTPGELEAHRVRLEAARLKKKLTPAEIAAAEKARMDKLALDWCGAAAWRRDVAWAYHQANMRRLAAKPLAERLEAEARSAATVQDIGQLVIMENDGTTVSEVPTFDLDAQGLRFTPDGADGYNVELIALNFTAPVGPALPLGDDDTEFVSFTMGFTFPFYGSNRTSVFVNSNGSLSFGGGILTFFTDLDEFRLSPPRIAPLFVDLSPNQGGAVRADQQADRLIVTWVGVPQFFVGDSNTMQVVLLDTGVIEFHFNGMNAEIGLTGLSPGISANPIQRVDFTVETPLNAPRGVGELFGFNGFDLSGRRLTFTPNGADYDVALGDAVFDSVLGTNLNLSDDSTAQVSFTGGFMFPFYGVDRASVFVNSNGSLTFGSGDISFNQALGSFFAAPARIGAIMMDLNPSEGGTVNFRQEMDRAIVTWRNVPEFPNVGANTCQVSLFNDGRVQLDYVSVADTALTTGIGPGDPSASVSIFDFSVEAPITAASGIIAEAFAASRVVDIARVGQRFYQTHADDYDFLVMFTNFSSDLGGAFAFELNLRNSIQGIGLGPINFGADFGSPGKLSSFVHMNDLTLHDEDSQNLVLGDNTSLAVIGHEVGHRWLAFPQIAGAAGLTADDLLGRALAHWSFYMNSNASFDEGNLWSETSPNVFTSVDTVSRYSPLDQYLMGLRAIGEVPPFFVINNSTTPGFQAAFPPTKGAVIDGARVEVTVQNIIAAEGDRVPGFPVTQREFTGAFILVTLAGQGPTGSELARLESLRSQFTPFFNEATNRRATFDSITHPENAVGGDAWRVYAGKDAGGPPPPR